MSEVNADLGAAELRSGELASANRSLEEDLEDVRGQVGHLEATVRAKQRDNERRESEFRSLKADFEAAAKEYEGRIASIKGRMEEEEEEEVEGAKKRTAVAEK